MRRSPVALPLAVLALALAGCGASASSSAEFEGEEKRVADAVERLQEAGEARDAEAICNDVLAEALRESIVAAGSTCEAELDKAIQDADDFELDVEDVTVQGTTATAKVRGADRLREFEFVREGDDWRATALGAS
jgi:hypothetical protein